MPQYQTWSQIYDRLQMLIAVVFSRPDGTEVSQTPQPIDPETERRADDWMQRFVRTGDIYPLPDDLRFALLGRATIAAAIADVAVRAGTPPPRGTEAIVYEELLVFAWHRTFRAMWLKGGPPDIGAFPC